MQETFLKEFQKRGYFNQCTDEAGLSELMIKSKIRAYIGFDCTAQSLHVGSLMQIMCLKLLQKYGHQPIVLLGGGTTLIGDPSGKEESRKILDKKQSSIEMPSAEDLFSNSKINLENEIEILKSSPILKQVIENLDLNIYIEGIGDVMSSQILSYPFKLTSKINPDSLKSKISFNLILEENGLLVTRIKDGKEYVFTEFSTAGVKHDLPFEITNIIKERYLDNSYNISFIPTSNLISSLKNSINVSRIGKNSDMISLNIKNSNTEYSKGVLNEIIAVFNKDGVKDRQLILKGSTLNKSMSVIL